MQGRRGKRQESLPISVANQVRSWQEVFNVSLADKETGSALSKLFWGGCDPVIVLNLLRAYSGIGVSLTTYKKEFTRWHRRIRRLCKRLAEDAKELRSIDEQHLQLDLDLPAQVEECVHDLKGMMAAEKSDVDETILSRGGGRQVYLVNAVRFVQHVTKGPHYSDLTAILCAMTGKSLGEGALRKNVAKWEDSPQFDPEQFKIDLQAIIVQNRANLAALDAEVKFCR